MSPRFALSTVLHACIAPFLCGPANTAEDTPGMPVRTIYVSTISRELQLSDEYFAKGR